MDYIIQPGDTLFLIARRFGTTVEEILRFNPRLQNQPFVFPGQIIHIPLPGEMPSARVSLYIVQPGETLTAIALKFNVPVGALLEANPQIRDPNLIFPGQIIVVPFPFRAVLPAAAVPASPALPPADPFF
ncbi:MAG TPA: LysM domain-containing protein [Bacillota bacterium]|nr:LysM domain-containing protein [Bacillota bacterium]